MPYPRDVAPDPATVRALAAGDPAAIAWWRGVQQRAAADPSLAAAADYVLETRAGPPPDPWRICPGCGMSKALRADDAMCPPCTGRGAAPGPSGAAMDGARALAILDGQADDAGQRRDMAYVETRGRLSAGEVRNPDDALAWLHDHMLAGTVQHGGPR